MEEGNVYNHIDFKTGVFSKNNAPAREIAIQTLHCPSYRGDNILRDDFMTPVVEPEKVADSAAKLEGGEGTGQGKSAGGTPGGAGAPADDKAAPESLQQLSRGIRAISSYAGCDNDLEAPIDVHNTGVFILNKQIRPESITDGLTHTIFVGEKLCDDDDLGWMAGTRATLRNTGSAPEGSSRWNQSGRGAAGVNPPNPLYVGGFSSDHPGVVNMLFGGGSVTSVSRDIELSVLQQLGNRADGKLLKGGPTRGE